MNEGIHAEGTVLIVDDDPDSLKVLSEFLNRAGLRVLFAKDGEQCLESAELGRPDLVLLDILMQGMGGYEVCRRLKKSPKTNDIPVIFLSALSEHENIVEGFKVGGVDYITKPFRQEEVLARVRTHVTLQRQKQERIERERALKVLHERLDGILKHTPNIVTVLDENGRYRHVNRAAERFLGLPKDRIVGASCRELLPPEVAETFMGRIQTVLETECVLEVEDVLPLDDGVHYFSSTLFPIFDADGRAAAVGGIAMNITKRMEAERELKKSREWYRALYDSVADAVFVHEVGADGIPGRFVEVNDAACDLLGYSREELLRLTPHDIDVTENEAETSAIVRKLSRREPIAFERTLVLKDGSRIPVELHSTPLILDEKPVALAMVRDLTERKNAEADRLRMEKRMQAHRRMESLGVLAGGIAHDFNNILMTIMGNIEMAKDEIPGASLALEFLDESEKASRRAADLVLQMLAYSGKGHFIMAPRDIGALVNRMEKDLRRTVPDNVSLNFDIAPDLPRIEGDEAQLRHLLMNLTVNAAESFKNGASGIITIAIGARTCDAACLAETLPDVWNEHTPSFTEGRYVCIDVRDTGCGMDADTRKRIFEPFFTTKFQGRGLGLASALGIIRGHRGYVHVESEPDRGTTVRVLLLALAEETLPEKERVAPLPRKQRRGAGVVLLVDDEASVRRMVGQVLEREGLTVIGAADGREALRRFDEAGGAVDLALIDLSMPGMSGIETLRELRRRDGDIPAVLTSGYSVDELRVEYADAGFQGFLQKPCPIGEIKTLLGNLMGRGNRKTD